MTKKLLFILTLSIHCFFSYSQQTVNIPLEKGETVLDFIELKDDGFIIKTGKDGYYTKNLSWKLSYFTKDLDKKWEAPIETQQMNKNHGEDLVASPSGSYVYHIENADNNLTMGTSSYNVSQVNKLGEVKTFELKTKDIYQYSSMIKMLYLCDEDYFYIISKEEESRKYSPKLHFYRIKHSDLKSSKVEIDLPALPSDDDSWEYAGHNSKHIWLASIAIDDKNDTNQATIIAVNWQGVVEKKNIAITNPLTGLYFTNFNSFHYDLSAKFFRKFDPRSKGNWNQVLVNDNNDIIYSFGFYDTKKNNGNAAFVRGYYVFAFDLGGKLLWKEISDQSDIMFEEKFYNRRLALQQRNIFAYLTSDNGLRLQIPTEENIYTYDFTKNGVKSQFVNSFEEPVLEYVGNSAFKLNKKYFFYCTPANTPLSKYYKTNYDKKKTFYATTQPLGEILIECEEKEGVKLLKW